MFTSRVCQHDPVFVAMKNAVAQAISIFVTDFADVSEPIHKLADVYLEMLGKIVEMPDVPEPWRTSEIYGQMTADFEITAEFLGIKNYSGMTDEHRNKWIGAFEIYLCPPGDPLGGYAPMDELVTAFENFRIWLLRRYKFLSAFGVEVDDDLRRALGFVKERVGDTADSVEQSLLAVEEEIARRSSSEMTLTEKLIASGTDVIASREMLLSVWLNELKRETADRETAEVKTKE